jgi:hypothetical protein
LCLRDTQTVPPQDALGASEAMRIRTGTKPPGKDNRRFPPGSTRLSKGRAPCRATLQGMSGCRKVPRRMQFPAPDVSSIIVDHRNRKSLLSFMVRIRQHSSNALMFRFCVFASNQDRRTVLRGADLPEPRPPAPAQRAAVHGPVERRSGRKAAPGTRGRAAGDDNKGFSCSAAAKHDDCTIRQRRKTPCHWLICATC